MENIGGNIDYTGTAPQLSEEHVSILKKKPSYVRAKEMFNFYHQPIVKGADKLFYQQAGYYYDQHFPVSDVFQMHPSTNAQAYFANPNKESYNPEMVTPQPKTIRYYLGNGEYGETNAQVFEDGYSMDTLLIFEAMDITEKRAIQDGNYVNTNDPGLSSYRDANKYLMQGEDNLETTASYAASYINRTLNLPDPMNSISNFFMKYAHQYTITNGRPPSSDEILKNLVHSQYYFVESPGDGTTNILIPKKYITQYEHLGTKDIQYGLNQLFLFMKNEKFRNDYNMRMGSDDGNRAVFIRESGDGSGLSFFFGRNENAPRAAVEDTNLKMSWEEIAKFSRYRIELAALEDVMNVHFTLDPKYKYNLIKEAVEIYNESFGDDDVFQRKMKLSRNLQGLLTDSRILGMYQEPYDLPFVPQVFEETARYIQNIPGRLIRNATSMWNTFSFTDSGNVQNPMGQIEYEVFVDFLSRVGEDTSVSNINKVFGDMVKQRKRQELNLWDDMVYWSIDNAQSAAEVVDIMHEKIEQTGVIDKIDTALGVER